MPDPATPPTRAAKPRVTFRLVNGTHPHDWHPHHGDAPCQVNEHNGQHPLDGCPDLHQ